MSLFRSSESRSVDGWEALRTFATGGGPLLGSGMKAALSLVPVYAATSLIADSLAILPMAGYETSGGVRRRLSPQPELCFSPHPNPVFTRAEWIQQFASSFLLRGNAYGLITAVDQRGVPSKIQWLNPDNVRVDEAGRTPVYLWNEKPLDPETVMHIPWYSPPGSVVGLSPIGQFKQQMEMGAAAAKFGNDWFRHGAAPSGHLKYSPPPPARGVLNNEQAAQVKERFKAAVAGGDVFVSGNDWDWKALSVNAQEAQFLQTTKATANQVAAIFKVSPEDIGGEAGSSMTYATVELNQIKFQIRALAPIFTRLEMHLSRVMPDYQYIKFNPDSIVRTDLKTRMEAHEIALRAGMETQDEGRALEDKAPLTKQELTAWQALYSKSQPTKEARDHA